MKGVNSFFRTVENSLIPTVCKKTPHEEYINSVIQYYKDKILKNQLKDITIDDIKKGLVALKKLGSFTVSEYKQLTQDELSCIRKLANDYIYDNSIYSKFNKQLKYHEIMVNTIKNTLDKNFGEGNYVVVSIGRSVSSVCNCLGYKTGKNTVKQIPLSDAKRFLCMENCKYEDFKGFCKYLDSIGLSKNEIKTSGKQYIFLDYCASGRSLKGAEKLFRSDKVYGDYDKIQFVNILDILKDCKPDEQELKHDFLPGTYTFADDIQRMFEFSRFKPYALVRNCYDLCNTQKSVIKPDEFMLEPRIFMFKVLDNEVSKTH